MGEETALERNQRDERFREGGDGRMTHKDEVNGENMKVTGGAA